MLSGIGPLNAAPTSILQNLYVQNISYLPQHVLDLSIRHNGTQKAERVKAEEKFEFDRQDTLVHFTKDFDQNRQRENTGLTDIDAMRHEYEEYINSVQNITNVSMLGHKSTCL